MSSLFLKDFRFGLDTRRMELTQRPGTLEVLTNGFVNQGGEVENRKAFVRTARVADTFGLQPTSSGLYTFGSKDKSANHPLNIGTGGKPIYVNFQRLLHPAVIFNAALYDAAKHDMTAVTFSEQFRGKAVVAARFTDGNTFAYYDGTLMRDFTDGLLMAHLSTNTLLADEIEDMVDRTSDYTAAKASATNVTVTGPLGEVFAVSVSKDTALGTLVAAKISDPTGPTEAQIAVGSFRVISGSSSAGTNKITQVEVNNVVVTNAAVDWTNSNEFTASLIAASINLKVSAPEYYAEANGSTVTIKSEASVGDAPNNFVVKVTAAGNVCVDKAQFQFIATAGYSIDAVYINGANILTAAIAWATAGSTASGMASAVAADINANTTAGTAHGYLACAKGSILSVSRAVTQSNSANLPIYFVGTTFSPGNGVFEIDTTNTQITAMTAVLIVTGQSSYGVQGGTRVTFYLSLSVSGGLAPYLSPVWQGATALTPVTSIGGNNYSVTVYGATFPNPTLPPHVYAVITDSLGNTVQSNTI